MAAILQSLAAEGRLTVHLAFIERHEQGPAEGTPGEWSLYEAHEAENEAHGLMNLDGSSAQCRSTKFELDDILNSQERLAAFIQQCVFLLSGYQRQLNGEAG